MRKLVAMMTLGTALALGGCGGGGTATNDTLSGNIAANAAAPTPEPSPTAEPALTATGWGPLRIGMTKDEVTEALGADSSPLAVGGPEPEACDEYRPERAPEGMLVMIEAGKLTRISIGRDSTVKTDAGLGLGATAAAVRAAYGDTLVAEGHKYIGAPAEYLTAWNGGKPSVDYVEDPAARGIQYEVGGEGTVTAIHAGGPSIQYVEGCS